MRGFEDFWGPSPCFIVIIHGKDVADGDDGGDGNGGDDGGDGCDCGDFLHTPLS